MKIQTLDTGNRLKFLGIDEKESYKLLVCQQRTGVCNSALVTADGREPIFVDDPLASSYLPRESKEGVVISLRHLAKAKRVLQRITPSFSDTMLAGAFNAVVVIMIVGSGGVAGVLLSKFLFKNSRFYKTWKKHAIKKNGKTLFKGEGGKWWEFVEDDDTSTVFKDKDGEELRLAKTGEEWMKADIPGAVIGALATLGLLARQHGLENDSRQAIAHWQDIFSDAEAADKAASVEDVRGILSVLAKVFGLVVNEAALPHSAEECPAGNGKIWRYS